KLRLGAGKLLGERLQLARLPGETLLLFAADASQFVDAGFASHKSPFHARDYNDGSTAEKAGQNPSPSGRTRVFPTCRAPACLEASAQRPNLDGILYFRSLPARAAPLGQAPTSEQE